MPLYEYECDACGRRFEQIQKFSDAPLQTCAECAPLASPGIHVVLLVHKALADFVDLHERD